MTDIAEEIRGVLYPSGDRDARWDVSMLETIAHIVTRDEPITVTFTREEANAMMQAAAKSSLLGSVHVLRQRGIQKLADALDPAEEEA